MTTSSNGLTIRIATPADLELLLPLSINTFTQAFASVNSAEDMANYLSSSFKPEVVAEELQNATTTFLLAEIDQIPAGYAKLQTGEVPPEVQGNSPIEVERFYIDENWYGRGVSHSLMQAVFDHARTTTHDVIWLGVWEHNQRAIAFYRKWQFEMIGQKPFWLGSDLQTDYLMSRSV